jgi:NADH-quinone oxidoreductase subunit L
MVMPLIVLSILSFFIWYTPNPMDPEAGWMYTEWIKNPELHTPENLRFGFMQSDVTSVITPPGEHRIMYSETYTSALHHVHTSAVILSIAMAVLGILLAFVIYQWKKISADVLAEKLKPLYKFSYNKWYFDELYDKTFVAGTIGLSKAVAWFDLKVIDGIVDGSAAITKALSKSIGWFDDKVIDGLVNFTAGLSGFIGAVFSKFQTGKVQTYIIMVIFSLVILLFLFKSF